MKKKFMPAFLPARYVQGEVRSYIVIHESGKRYRLTFSLNRIHNFEQRENRADQICRKINFWLERGKPLKNFEERKVTLEVILKEREESRGNITMLQAIELARDIRLQTTERRASIRSHQSHTRNFIAYLDRESLTGLPLSSFTAHDAIKYTDYWITELKISNNNTFNNKLGYVKGYFNLLVEREYIEVNPFAKIKSRRKTKSRKENFTQEEMKVIAAAAMEKSKWLWVAIQLAFWGLIRQEEIARLKLKWFDLDTWCIYMPAEATKNLKEDIITLPIFLRQEFSDLGVFNLPSNCFIFGKGMEPHPKEMIGERTFHKFHRTILRKLKREGKIQRTVGLSFSSWRKTGMDYFSNVLTPREFKDHNRHDNFATTERYLPGRKFLPAVSQLERKLFL